MLDIDVMAAATRFVAVRMDPAAAAAACRAELDPLDGVKLAARIIGVTLDVTLSELTATHCTPLTVEQAWRRRGAFLVDTAGRVAVTVGWGRVVQPAGRRYALVDSGPQFWVAAWWPTVVTVTLQAS